MHKFDNLSGVFQAAWSLLLDYPKITNERLTDRAIKDSANMVIMAIPVIALAVGVALWIIGSVLGAVLPHLGASVLWAVLALAVLECKDSFRSFTLITSLADLKASKRKWVEALMDLSTDWAMMRTPAATVTMIAVALIKLFALGALCYSGKTWFIAVVLLMDFAAQGTLAMERSILDGSPIVKVKQHERSQIWLVTGFFCLFFLISGPIAVLAAFGLVFVAVWLCKGFFLAAFDGVDANLISLTGGIAQLIALLCGLILLA